MRAIQAVSSSASKPMKAFTTYERMFRKHHNAKFARDSEVACRGALLVVLAGLPFVMPAHSVKAYTFISEGWYTAFTISCFLFAYYKDVGNTVNLAFSGTLGVFISLIGAWFLFGIFPESITSQSGPGMYAVAFSYGAAYVFVMLWLNVNTNTSVFAISSFVWHFMAFLNPSQTPDFDVGFEINLRGSATKSFIASVVGSLLAIACMVLPYPMTALGKASGVANDVVPALFSAWTGLTAIVCAATKEDMNDFIVAKLKRELNSIHEKVQVMEGHLDMSWWECFGFSGDQHTRGLLRKMDSLLTEVYDRLMSISCICLRDSSPSEIMGRVQPFIEAVTAEANYLLGQGLAAAANGAVNQDRAAAFAAGSARLRNAYRNLTTEFRRQSSSRESSTDVISSELLGESAFCLAICAFGRLVADWADDVAARPLKAEGAGFLGLAAGVFDGDVLFHNKGHMQYVLRSWCSICLGFCLGYSSMLDFGAVSPQCQYNPAIASAAAVLLSKTPGSAIVRNLSRMQGAVLGAASGSLIYSILGSCNMMALIGLPIFLFVWCAFTLFLYNNSVVNSDMGFLLVYFGTSAMLVGCGKEASGGLAKMVVNLLCTVVIMTAVDLAFQGKNTASHQAHDGLLSSLRSIRNSLSEVFDPDIQTLDFRGRVLATLISADSMGVQAKSEPRWHKTPWRPATFARAMTMATNMRFILNGMKFAAVGGSKAGPRSHKFMACLELREVMDCAGRPAQRMAQVEEMLTVLLEEQDTRSKFYNQIEDEIMAAMAIYKYDQMVDAACSALNKSTIFCSGFVSDSLEQDHTVQISYQLAGLGAIIWESRHLAAGIIAEG